MAIIIDFNVELEVIIINKNYYYNFTNTTITKIKDHKN